jgi:hypothetical protein
MANGVMNFNKLSWAALCYYYWSAGDKKYARIMRDSVFTSKLKEEPFNINDKEFEEKVILDYISIDSYDLLVQRNLAGSILATIVELQPEISSLQNVTIMNCDFMDSEIVEQVDRIYESICSIYGLWLTGVSKIMHILNDQLFPPLNLRIADYFGVLNGESRFVDWLGLVQRHAQAITKDFQEQGFSRSPEAFLSDKLGYTKSGYEKSLVKFLDEYYWLGFGENLPIPPNWAPPYVAIEA